MVNPSLQALAIVHFGNDLVHCDQQDDVDNDYVYPNVFMSNEDTEQVSNLQADLQTYMNTQKANWIMNGTKDAEWNDYLSKLEAYGLSDYLGIMQKYLDAYYA